MFMMKNGTLEWLRRGLVAALLLGSTAWAQASGRGSQDPQLWRALHLLHFQTDDDLCTLEKQLPALAAQGINTLILEVDYGFEFRSHPELRAAPQTMTRKGIKRLLKASRRQGMRVIPQFQCLGHQSWEKETYALLTRYPELDLTPGAFPENQGIYCREWDIMNPRVNEIVFALLDEIIDAFEADALHVGMDEVFLLGNEASPSTRGQDPAELYAKAVNDVHAHVTGKRGCTMLMWGDRLIDGARYDYGEWESARNGTASAIDRIPKDIVICDWHYEPRESYPSVPMFIEKGFRVLPTSWRDVSAARALVSYSLGLNSPAMLGHLFTRWSAEHEGLATWPALVEAAPLLRRAPATSARVISPAR
jgi:hypothetical protein